MSCKYTDEEIKKILECCSKSDCENCTRDWSYVAQWDCMRHIERLALDLINHQQFEIYRLNAEIRGYQVAKEIDKEHYERQQAEIKRLQAYHDDMESAIYSFREDHAKVKFFKGEIRAEAIKEFIKSCRKRSEIVYGDRAVPVEVFEEVAKEIVGDTE